jgi:hypothetical protein
MCWVIFKKQNKNSGAIAATLYIKNSLLISRMEQADSRSIYTVNNLNTYIILYMYIRKHKLQHFSSVCCSLVLT